MHGLADRGRAELAGALLGPSEYPCPDPAASVDGVDVGVRASAPNLCQRYERIAVEDKHGVERRLEARASEVHDEVLRIDLGDSICVQLACGDELGHRVSVRGNGGARGQTRGQIDHGERHPGQTCGCNGSRKLLQGLQRVAYVVERVPADEGHTVAFADRHEFVLREDHIRVQRPVSVRLPLADERDRTVRFAGAERREHLARPAAHALRMSVRVPEGPYAVPVDEFVRHDLEALETRCFQDRPDVEAEAVRDEGEREFPFLCPRDERLERRVERALGDGLLDHLLPSGGEHRRLVRGGVAQAHLVTVDHLPVPLPGVPADALVPERLEQDHGDIGHARRPVEVDHDRADGKHRSQPAERSAQRSRKRTNARVGEPVAPSGHRSVSCSVQAELPVSR